MPRFIPSAVQIQYDRVMEDGLPGSQADANPTMKDSFIAEGGDVPFGVVISRGSIDETNGNTTTGRIGKTGVIAATSGYAIGTGIVEETITEWTSVSDGSFEVYVDGGVEDISACDFSAITNLTDVAAVVETKLQAVGTGGYSAATCTYDASANRFTITSGTTGVASTVSDLTVHSTGVGTSIHEMLGMDTAYNVDGQAITTLLILGVTYRSVTHSSTLANSGTPTVTENQIGVFQNEGKIKVLAQASALDGADVYFSDTTGEIYFAADTGLTQLGSAKLRGDAVGGKVAIIDIIGVR